MPTKQKEVKEFHNIVQNLREIGRNKILERINAFKNNEHLPDDILSAILKSNSNYKKLSYINVLKAMNKK